MLSSGQLALLIISLIGLSLNIIVGSIVTFGLKLVTTDLVLIAIISATDMCLYIMNILRVIVTSTGAVIMDHNEATMSPSWWCPLDVAITMTGIGSSIELVAILSLMRYVKICLQKDVKPYVWYLLCFCSIALSAGLALGNTSYGLYHWSSTDMFCLPALSTGDDGVQNRPYYLLYFSAYAIRVFISLVVITFCYIKVTTTYRGAIKTTLARSIEEQNNKLESRLYLEAKGSGETQDMHMDDYVHTIQSFKLKRAVTTIKLISATVGYIVCLLPDIILTILDLTIVPDYDIGTSITVNCLIICCGIVSSFFVLFSHAQSRQYFFSIIKPLTKSIGLA